jgi:hypothetical protein
MPGLDYVTPPVYAGVGARTTPADVLALMREIAAALAADDWTLRTGGAEGADTAWEEGARHAAGRVELFLPWPGFRGRAADMDEPAPAAYEIAARFHPAWRHLGPGVRRLHARNTHQVLGAALDHPADMLICWTPRGAGGGGTGQAIRVARGYGVPVFDLAGPATPRTAAELARASVEIKVAAVAAFHALRPLG